VTTVAVLLDSHRFHERFWAQRMLGLYRSGRQADALAAYAEAQRVLADELGIDPGTELRSLHDQVLRQVDDLDQPTQGAHALEPPGPARLPRTRGSLIGRERSLAEVAAAFETARLVTVTGPGGAGKTRLAIEAAQRLLPTNPDGVWFVDLAQLGPEEGDATRLRDIVASSLQLAPRAGLAVGDLLAERLKDRRLLLVVDNCEQVLDAVATVIDALLDASPGVRVLGTSRESLDVADEVTVSLAPLSGDDATALFVDRLSSLRPDLDPEGADRDVIDSICEAVGGLPLGIEMAAARARVFELDEVAASLTDGATGLTRSGRGPQRHASMLETVEWGYRLARPDEQVLHRRLSLLPGAVTVEAARVLCSVAPLTPDQAPALLAGLVHRSLLTSSRPDGGSGVTTFRQLVPTRGHAERRLDAEERLRVAAARDAWLVGAVRGAALDGGPGQAEATAWVRDNATAVSATLTAILVEDPQPAALEVLARLTLYWFERGQLLDAAHWYRAAVAATASGAFAGSEAVVARVLDLCVRALGQDRGAAEAIAEELPRLGIADTPADAVVAETLVLVGVSTWVTRVPEVGRSATSSAITLGERLGRRDVVQRARALSAMHRLSSPDRGVAFADARGILESDQDNAFAAFVAGYVCSTAALEDGDVEGALGWMRRTARAHSALAMHPTSELLEDVARLLSHSGQPGEALRCYASAAARHAGDGLPWPRLPHSPGILDSLRSQLGSDDYDRLWHSGERLGRYGDPVTLLDEWLPGDGSIGSSGLAARRAYRYEAR
jgi:predicted ATPase